MILNVILITIIFSIATQLPSFINFSSAVFTASILSPSLAPIPSVNTLAQNIITTYLLTSLLGYSVPPSLMLSAVYDNSSMQQIFIRHLSLAYYVNP